MSGLKIEQKVHFGKTGRCKTIKVGEAPPRPAPGRVPRTSRLMALAIRMEQLVHDRVVVDYADVARLGQISRARVSQILNLTLLAPDIQEEILHLPRAEQGRDPIRERHVRPIAAMPDWGKQRRMWIKLAHPSPLTRSSGDAAPTQ